MNTLESRFAEAVWRCRNGLRLSQIDLAALMQDSGWDNANQAQVSRIERGERHVSLGEAAALARILGFSLSEVVDGKEVSPSPAASERLLLDEVQGTLSQLALKIELTQRALKYGIAIKDGIPHLKEA
ncbi:MULTISPECIES: helix-turn-helix domain-containing protein [Arthrobacter]|uniref:XRE family transcriptional regulator n=1 Tax=Arthrobacter terricola TaxID=2547396 RepID=A0A4R5KNQ4_9MICC|nr:MULTISPECIES: helix-turn-helix transcriptional regulator [Arthrobacter]MBT8161043.1 helix-turn-helix domain-containing protein [Arthrobacter sp. GN70]TDF96902.1 XRE family transcriptional regulator [Arthrobacter terricola]